MRAEKATPFDFDLELAWLEYRICSIFGQKIMEYKDMKELLEDFRRDKSLFAQFWDTINYHLEEVCGEYD